MNLISKYTVRTFIVYANKNVCGISNLNKNLESSFFNVVLNAYTWLVYMFEYSNFDSSKNCDVT